MKIDDLVESPLSKYGVGNPMGLSQKVGAGLRSLVPGGTGQRAKGELEVGKVANIWKDEYMRYVGRTGISKHGTTETFLSFLKNKKFTDDQIAKVMKGTISEAALLYERGLGVGEIDILMMRAAKVAAASEFDPSADIPDEPDPTAPRQPGVIDKAVDLGKKAAPHIAKASSKIGQQALNFGKKYFTKTPQQDVPRNMPPLVKAKVSSPKFEPSKKSPKMKMKPKSVTRYK